MDYETFFVEKIPQAPTCFPGVNVRCGTRLITILGILFGFTCAVMLLMKDRKNLSTTTLVLVLFLSVFIIVTVMFVLASVLLLMAALDEDPHLMSYYIWLSIVYLCVQLVLAIFIPLVLIVEGQYPVAVALVWLVIVMIVGLVASHVLRMPVSLWSGVLLATLGLSYLNNMFNNPVYRLITRRAPQAHRMDAFYICGQFIQDESFKNR